MKTFDDNVIRATRETIACINELIFAVREASHDGKTPEVLSAVKVKETQHTCIDMLNRLATSMRTMVDEACDDVKRDDIAKS